MIEMEQRAHLKCDHDGCAESVRIRLVLLPTGALMPIFPKEASANGWRCIMDRAQPHKPYQGMCREHGGGSVVPSIILQ